LNRGSKVKDISLTVRKGEIVGLAGLLGSGRSELLKCIFGSDQIDSGKIEVRGKEYLIRSPKNAIAAGIGFLPENRRREGLCLKMTATDNIVLAIPEKVFQYGVTNKKRRTKIAGNSARDVDFSPNYMDVECGTLSGGNQQKALLARWLSRNSDVLMLDEPTNGIDVNTKSEIHNLIRQLAAKGKGILIVSSDFPELLGLCHHIIVLRDGRITMDISNSELTESELLGYAAGQHMGA
ncbi:MAG TPA: D-xylose ABC transporter ATP-binding protein, partial [Firmicutes bacterium]|nr:D-xylose ABC transporter ATP-binding protein [Bacillota bacterium]HBR23001.1 D-xylose ABC transporter ATP-binding protein [Bacillota bacterium]